MTAVGTGIVPDPVDLSEMYCEETIRSDDVLAIFDAAAEGWADHPSYREFGVGCYVGAKLFVDEKLYGTLCFLDREPREEPFTHAEKAFVDLTSRWVSHLFERRERERDRRRVERAMDAAPVGVTITDPA